MKTRTIPNSTSTNKILTLLLAGTSTIYGYLCKKEQEKQKAFNNLSLDEQKKIYDSCILQKLPTDYSGMAAISERMYQNDSKFASMPPLKPFKPR